MREKKINPVMIQQSLITHDAINLSKRDKNCSVINRSNNHPCRCHAFTLKNELANVSESFTLLSGENISRERLKKKGYKNCMT